jgi:hypothetical protein
VSIQDELHHHAFKPGNIWFLDTKEGVSQGVKKYQNVMPIWKIVNDTAEVFFSGGVQRSVA